MVNLVVMLGNVTRNPELKYGASGAAVAKAGLAVNRRFKQGEDLKESVCFVDIVLFGKSAEAFAQYVSKGDPVHVIGRLEQNRWEDEHGQKHSRHEVVCEQWKTLKRREGGGEPDGSHTA